MGSFEGFAPAVHAVGVALEGAVDVPATTAIAVSSFPHRLLL
ncbi:hypothetical protein [Brachybacterium timonense]|nr:hypothetical protein [Brachybacterium timonense]